MDNSTLQDERIDTGEHLTYKPGNRKLKPLSQEKDRPLPASTRGPSRDHGAYGRPITLKAGLHAPEVDGPGRRPSPALSGGGIDLTARGARPIGLKPELEDHVRGDVAHPRKAQTKKNQRARPETPRAKTLKDPATRAQAKTPRQRSKSPAPRPKREVAVGTPRGPRVAAAIEGRAASSPAGDHPVEQAFEVLRAWAGTHRRLLWTIGLSFGAGLMVRGWFAADVPQPVSQVVESPRATQSPVTKVTTPVPQRAPSPRYTPQVYGQPAPRRDDYAPLDGFYLAPAHRATQLQQTPPSQYGNATREWGDYGQHLTARPLVSAPRRQPGGEAIPSYWDAARKQYNPWTREEWAYR